MSCTHALQRAMMIACLVSHACGRCDLQQGSCSPPLHVLFRLSMYVLPCLASCSVVPSSTCPRVSSPHLKPSLETDLRVACSISRPITTPTPHRQTMRCGNRWLARSQTCKPNPEEKTKKNTLDLTTPLTRQAIETRVPASMG